MSDIEFLYDDYNMDHHENNSDIEDYDNNYDGADDSGDNYRINKEDEIINRKFLSKKSTFSADMFRLKESYSLTNSNKLNIWILIIIKYIKSYK